MVSANRTSDPKSAGFALSAECQLPSGQANSELNRTNLNTRLYCTAVSYP